MTWEQYYRMRLERLEKSGLKNLLEWDISCHNFAYTMWAKQFTDKYILKTENEENTGNLAGAHTARKDCHHG